jgi:hypothetical protein
MSSKQYNVFGYNQVAMEIPLCCDHGSYENLNMCSINKDRINVVVANEKYKGI